VSARSRNGTLVVAGAGALVAAAAFAAPPAPASESPSWPLTVVVFSGPAPQGRYSVRVVMEAGDAEANERVRAAVGREISRAEGTLLRRDPSSAVSRFNAHASSAPFAVPVELVEAAFAARRVAEMTGGAFDPTGSPQGFVGLAVEPSRLTLAKARPDLSLDLDTLAGGWLADRIAAAISALGYHGVLADVGGEVAGRGRRADGSHWHVAVSRDRRGEPRVVTLDDASIATAADDPGPPARRGAAPRPGRVVDARTGRPVGHALASATVVHPDGATAGALAAALLVLGPADGRALAEREHLAVRLVERRPDGTDAEWSSASFAALVVK
jgi:thiamine biosynthesis lipoprotein